MWIADNWKDYELLDASDGERLERITEDRAISLSTLADELRECEEKIYLCGDGYEVARKALLAEGITLCNTPSLLICQNGASVALVAKRKYDKGEYVSDSALSPVYLRMPQAERERLERLESGKEG